MPNIEKLKLILIQRKQEFSQTDPNVQLFIINRIIGGNSIFDWRGRILHVAFCLSTRRKGQSTQQEQDQDYEAARLIVENQMYKLAKRKIHH